MAVEISTPFFTTCPKRVAVLQRNAAEGHAREQLPLDVQRKMDLADMFVSKQKLAMLRINAGVDKA